MSDVVKKPEQGRPDEPTVLRGDYNVDISDAVFTLNWLFLGGSKPGCLARP